MELKLVIGNLNVNSFGHLKAIPKHKLNILALVKTKLSSILSMEDFRKLCGSDRTNGGGVP